MECKLPGPSVLGILQARILERVAISFSRGSSQPRNRTRVSCIASKLFTTELQGKPNIKGAESSVSLVSHCMEIAPCNCPGSAFARVSAMKERNLWEVWRRTHFHQRIGFQDGLGAQSIIVLHTALKRALFWFFSLPPSSLFFECFRNKRVFSSKLRWEANSWTV